MNLKLLRLGVQADIVPGVLFNDGRLIMYAMHRTGVNIPSGRYGLVIDRAIKTNNPHFDKIARIDSKFYQARTKKKNENRKHGVIKLVELPGTLIQAGNIVDECGDDIVVGNKARENVTRASFLGDSPAAYQRLYLMMLEAEHAAEVCTLDIVDA